MRVIAIDPEAALVERAAKEMDGRLVLGSIADIRVGRRNADRARRDARRATAAGSREARAALDNRPAAWATIAAQTPGRLHPARSLPRAAPLCRARSRHGADLRRRRVRPMGPEHASGAPPHDQRRRRLDRRLALVRDCGAAAEPKAPVFAVLGDGTIGFHLSEFETAVRRKLPFVAVLGNDALWNAESQIQLREYGKERMHGCDLTPARYDLVVAALGGHGEFVESAADLPGAIERALASGKPACINVMIESIAAPVIRL